LNISPLCKPPEKPSLVPPLLSEGTLRLPLEDQRRAHYSFKKKGKRTTPGWLEWLTASRGRPPFLMPMLTHGAEVSKVRVCFKYV
jgi:hypothetical protein